MAIDGYVDYKKREYCHAIQCPVQALLDGEEVGSKKYEEIRKICQTDCLQTSHEFHKWLDDQGYIIIKPN